jgi:predicted acylesterase/phospholipase RssA
MQPTPVAIACQGGGAHTAFTAGALSVLLDAEATGPIAASPPFRITALSGTSGGAVCAALAWTELLMRKDRPSNGGPSRLEGFWTDGYPDGNAALPYLDAWLQDMTGFLHEGRLPGLRSFDRLRTDLGLSLLTSDFPGELSPLRRGMEARPYYFYQMFGLLDSLTPPLIRDGFERTQAMIAALPADGGPAAWLRNFLQDWLSLSPLARGGLLRRELDAQDAFRTLLQRYLSADDLARLRRHVSADGRSCPELLLGAVDVLRVQPDGGSCAERTRALLTDICSVAGEAANDDDADPAALSNFRVFRGAADLDHLVDAVLASAAMPNLMRAVALDGSVFWDGLFSANPPLIDLPHVHSRHPFAPHPDNPAEIWVIMINPLNRDEEPRSLREIEDRRNELAGNISFLQEVRAVRRLDQKRVKATGQPPLVFRVMAMDEALSGELDYASKLDRRREQIERLMAEGRRSAAAFLDTWRRS